jgi:abhydrolase domain-containing protein 17
MKELLVLTALLYVALSVVVSLVADRLIFLPPTSSYSDEQLPIVLVDAGDDVRIATMYLPNPTAVHTILYSHGNAEDIGHIAPILRQLQQIGFSVLAYDYRGYGLSTGGPPSATGAYRDIEAVYRYAVEELAVPPERLILLGRSVGSGPAIQLAAREPVGGLVVESGFVSAFRVMTRIPLFPFDRFPNLRHIREVNCPVLVIHGTHDEVIPMSHGKRLFEAAPEPKHRLWIDGGRHNDLLAVAGAAYWNALVSFSTAIQEQPPS